MPMCVARRVGGREPRRPVSRGACFLVLRHGGKLEFVASCSAMALRPQDAAGPPPGDGAGNGTADGAAGPLQGGVGALGVGHHALEAPGQGAPPNRPVAEDLAQSRRVPQDLQAPSLRQAPLAAAAVTVANTGDLLQAIAAAAWTLPRPVPMRPAWEVGLPGVLFGFRPVLPEAIVVPIGRIAPAGLADAWGTAPLAIPTAARGDLRSARRGPARRRTGPSVAQADAAARATAVSRLAALLHCDLGEDLDALLAECQQVQGSRA